MKPVAAEELREVLRHFKRNSYTPDIPIVLFKEAPDTALDPLRRIINAILENPKTMTSEELTAHLILLPKDDPLNLASVRPITMCGALYKMVAFVLSSRIMRIMETHPFLLESNVGFTPHGETNHLVVAIQALFDANQATPARNREHMHALLVDLSKAYDTVPWFAMLETLTHLGFPQAVNEWILHTLQETTTFLKFPQGITEQPLDFTPTRG
jgi:hypothetical protein